MQTRVSGWRDVSQGGGGLSHSNRSEAIQLDVPTRCHFYSLCSSGKWPRKPGPQFPSQHLKEIHKIEQKAVAGFCHVISHTGSTQLQPLVSVCPRVTGKGDSIFLPVVWIEEVKDPTILEGSREMYACKERGVMLAEINQHN